MSLVSNTRRRPNKTKKSSTARTIFAASLGNGLEIFDFTIYSFFASIIGKLYFPSDSAYASLLMSVTVFGVGFVMRPLGSMVLGAYADRAGRKAAMLRTILIMGLGTCCIAFAPTYEQIGIFAPIILVIGRLLQGFSAGGEVGSATALLLESAGANQKGFFVSWQSITQGISSLIGATLGVILTYSLSEHALYSWGWRIPFILGLAIIPAGLYIRKHLHETYNNETTSTTQSITSNPVWQLLTQHLKDFILGIFIIMSGTVLVYIVLLYMPTFMMETAHLSDTISYLFSCIAAITQIIAVYFCARYIDYVKNYKRPMVFSIILAIIFIYPTFYFLMNSQLLWLAVIFRILLIIALGINMLTSTLLIVDALPRHVRATGTAMTYAFGVTIFGGSAQVLVTWLLEISKNPMSPAWYLIVMLLISLIATLLFKERHDFS